MCHTRSPARRLPPSLVCTLILLGALVSGVRAQLPNCAALCLGDYEGGDRVFWNDGGSGLGNYTFVDPRGGQFIENLDDGTLRIVGEIVSVDDAGKRFFVDLVLGGRVDPGDPGYAPDGSPKLEGDLSVYVDQGGPIDPGNWYYYTTLDGTMTGLGDFAGAIVDGDRRGPAGQVGIGANLKSDRFGFSVWIDWTTLQQPTGSASLPNTWHGDINGDLGLECTDLPFEGGGDDLTLCSGVNEAPAGGPGENVRIAVLGDTINFAIKSPNGTYTGEQLIFAVNCFGTCEPFPAFYPPPFDNVFMTPGSAESLEIFGPNGLFGPVVLGSQGFSVSFPVYEMFQGMSLLFQAYVISSQANNGFLAITDAHRIDVAWPTALMPAPSNLAVTTVEDHAVGLDWDDASMPNEGIAGYRVYRNGTLVAESTDSEVIVTGLAELSSHGFEVAAVSGIGRIGHRSPIVGATTVADVTPPTVMHAHATGETQIEVAFDEPIEPGCVADLDNWELHGGASILGATVGVDGRTAVLTTGIMNVNQVYMITISGIEDLALGHNVMPTEVTMPVTRPRVTADLVALWDIEDGAGTVVHDVSNVGAPLDLVIDDPSRVSWLAGGLSLDQSTIVRSAQPAAKIATACQASEEISVEAWVRPADDLQAGPARIATFSLHTTQRNFTLAQDGDDWVMRLRTDLGDANGTPNMTAANLVVTDAMTHLVYTRNAAGAWTYWIDGQVAATGVRTGDFSNWDGGWDFALGNEMTMNRTWLGEIHLVAVYARALGADEIAQNFDAGP